VPRGSSLSQSSRAWFAVGSTRSPLDLLFGRQSPARSRSCSRGSSPQASAYAVKGPRSSLSQKQLAEENVAAIAAEIQTKGWATITDSKVTFFSTRCEFRIREVLQDLES